MQPLKQRRRHRRCAENECEIDEEVMSFVHVPSEIAWMNDVTRRRGSFVDFLY